MNEQWNRLTVTDICFAMYVSPHMGKRDHTARPYHGFVLNDPTLQRRYIFEDGHVLNTEGGSLFYLPKGSSYRVDSVGGSGGCYAINFDAEIEDAPFCVTLKNNESLSRNFKAAADAWKSNDCAARALAMRAVYDAVCRVQRELHKQYVSGEQASLIAPAFEMIDRRFHEADISVTVLAAACGISEVYFRRLFFNVLGVSPKEYIIQKRIEYAKTLLRSQSFSVAEIAILCGYSEPCHFSREFKKRTGTAPKDYV